MARPPLSNYESFMKIVGGHTAFQLMWSGIEFKLFDLIHEKKKMSFEDIQKTLKLEYRPTRILLTGLVALRLLDKEGGMYTNTAEATQFLVSSTPGNWVKVLGWQRYIVYPGSVDLAESMRKNTNVGLRHFKGTEDNLYARLTHDKELEKIFQDAMSGLSMSSNHVLTNEFDFSKIKHMVDAGGGDGTNAMTIVKKNPHMRMTVFDSPDVCEIANRNVQKNGMSEKVKTHPGDLFTTPFPKDIDAVLLAHLLTIWSPENNVKLLRRVYDALPTGGQAIAFNMMGNEDETGPMTTALGSPYFLAIATGQGMLYSTTEIAGFLKEAGFQSVKTHALNLDHFVVAGIK